ncbi:MAG: hypothetical protein PHV23_00340 [Candidatus Gracilibacteria bacterium]|nr:hypothetical protein [Candidatus Gracilibacteria bacterium]
MKKIIITFFVFITIINNTYAAGCVIKDKSSPALLEYIENNRKIIKTISSQLSEDTTKESLSKNIDDEYNKTKSSGLKIYNQIFNFDSYYSYFSYFATFPISNEVPKEVKRDYKLIESEGKGIKYYLDQIVKNGKSELVIKNICKDITVNCDFTEEMTAAEIIGKLTANNEAIMDLFRNAVIGEIYKNPTKLTLINNNFEAEIQTNYGIVAYSKCSEEKGGFFDTISTKIQEIGELNKEGKDGIQKWKDAIDLMLGNDTTNEKYSDTEKRVLKNELSKQGISGDSQSNMLNSLEKYNSEGLSKDNNFIKNTFNNTRVKLEKKLRAFKNEVIGDFFKKKTGDSISIESTISAQKNSTDTNKIKEDIDKQYLELLNLSADSETNTANLRSRILNVHFDLSNSINTLEGICPNSVNVCKQQDSGKGDCGKCN